jgi:hypothetical protein
MFLNKMFGQHVFEQNVRTTRFRIKSSDDLLSNKMFGQHVFEQNVRTTCLRTKCSDNLLSNKMFGQLAFEQRSRIEPTCSNDPRSYTHSPSRRFPSWSTVSKLQSNWSRFDEPVAVVIYGQNLITEKYKFIKMALRSY